MAMLLLARTGRKRQREGLETGMEQQRLKDKVMIVTGAGSGLGAAAAVRFAQEGASVFCADIAAEAAQQTAADIRAAGGQAEGSGVDVTSPEDLELMASAALRSFGQIDALYANAGVPGEGSVPDITPEAWLNTISVNLTGVFLSARAVLPSMLERKSGCIINQASVAGIMALPALASYAASKGGVVALTRQMALDFAPRGIRVNAICPGTVPTPLVKAAYERRLRAASTTGIDAEEAMEQDTGRVPLGRLGTEADVTSLAAFLASDEASWITGAIYTVDGGMTLRSAG
jgi:NAD(P)-dependent dehydrogenase (short-subunit alcohol dehydrogenase family)